MKRILKSTRFHLLLFAASLFVISSIFGLSAYLSDKQTYTSSFRTATSDELGFKFTGSELSDQLLTPGVSYPMAVGVKVSGPNSLYAFIDFNPSSGLIVEGFNSTSWDQIAEDSTVYYYGTDSSLVALDKTNNPEAQIFTGVSVPLDSQTGENYALSITGYAIQSDGIPASTDPSVVCGIAQESIKQP